MDMNEFNQRSSIKFLIVLGKMHASVFGGVEKHIKELGLNHTEFLILYAIAANGALTIQDVGHRISMTSGNMTYTVDKLEERGLLKRERCSKDRRKIYIDLTESGSVMWQQIMKDHIAFMDNAFEAIDDGTLDNMIESMKRIGKNFQQ